MLEQEEIRTKAEEKIEAISITQENNKKQLKNKIKKEESFWKYLTNFFTSACNVENKGGNIKKIEIKISKNFFKFF
ncbi:unnamed protein product [Meloidogyne enterolobii]|uniref:Uncharacterized protein n=1 Tax=Meloidogyne enterolobii TaxID=390850 RepID=A0ACB0ZX45_MELEN